MKCTFAYHYGDKGEQYAFYRLPKALIMIRRMHDTYDYLHMFCDEYMQIIKLKSCFSAYNML